MDVGPVMLTSIDDAVLREWRRPGVVCLLPARRPIQLPDSWTVVTTTGVTSPWAGDVPLVADGNHSCDLVARIRIEARTITFLPGGAKWVGK